LRSLHEATGVGIWLSCFVLAYLARRVVPQSAPQLAATYAPDDALGELASPSSRLRAT
jgi:hypothetical protein